VSILVISVFILSEIPNLKKNIEETKCSLFVSIDTALNGNGGDWGGFIAFRDNVGIVLLLLFKVTSLRSSAQQLLKWDCTLQVMHGSKTR